MSGEAKQHTDEDTGVEPDLAVDAAAEPDRDAGDADTAESAGAPAGDAAAEPVRDEPATSGDAAEAEDAAEAQDSPDGDSAEAAGDDPVDGSEAPADDDRTDEATADTQAEQDAPAPAPSALRIDYGAHLEANYPRLVAQLYAVTLDAAEAHDVVQDAYSRAWRQWDEVGRSTDPTAWVRRVAVRSTIRSWRRLVARLGLGRSHRSLDDDTDPRTRALLGALGRLAPAERRAVVLFHMAGVPAPEIAAVEQVSLDTVYARLHRARTVVIEGMADVLTAVLGADEELEYR